MITVLQPGLLTTLQDEGRLGYQKYGVPVAGAMDSLALHTANLLAGNDIGEACLEITGLGPTLRFETPVAFALSGGEFSPTLDGVPLEMNRAYSAPRGSVLQVGACKRGFRCYLAVNGGFDVPLVMNSRSTYLIASLPGESGLSSRRNTPWGKAATGWATAWKARPLSEVRALTATSSPTAWPWGRCRCPTAPR